MNSTNPFSEAERARQVENRLNAAVRHCRIGKIKFKAAYPRQPFEGLPPFKNGVPYIWQPKTGEPCPIAWWQNPVVWSYATGHTH